VGFKRLVKVGQRSWRLRPLDNMHWHLISVLGVLFSLRLLGLESGSNLLVVQALLLEYRISISKASLDFAPQS
jgi:hypothetical protein